MTALVAVSEKNTRLGSVPTTHASSNDMAVRMAFLRVLPLFSQLPLATLETIASELHLQHLERNARVFNEGDDPDCFYLIQSGWVKIQRETASGRSVLFELRGVGETIGTIALTDQRPLSATAVCATAVEILTLPASRFLQLLEEHVGLQQGYWHEVNHRLREARDWQTQIAYPVQGRLAQLFLRLAERMGESDGNAVRLPRVLTRQDIADMVGTTVETVIRTISKWRDSGLFETTSDQLILGDVREMAYMASIA